MGKPYNTELAQLAHTYQWALKQPIDYLTKAIKNSAPLPLLVVGSGGSLTAAHFAVSLHQKFTNRMARAATPLDAAYTCPRTRDLAVMLLSAGGSNPDILGIFKEIVKREPDRFTVMCARSMSPLGDLARKYRYVDFINFDPPSGKDGFLATNSLLAFYVLLYRAYVTLTPTGDCGEQVEILPSTLEDLLHPSTTSGEYLNDLSERCKLLWQRETTSVLYGPSVHSAVIDFESKFTEAAIGSTQIADYRNFAHGRHLWLAKRGADTGVLALITEDDRRVAEKTLKHIPSEVPVVRLEVPHAGPLADLAALVLVLNLAGLAGRARDIDPGRPGVPTFGSKIYNLRTFDQSSKAIKPRPPKYTLIAEADAANTLNEHLLSEAASTAIERKAGRFINELARGGTLATWHEAYDAFSKRLRRAAFKALVLDYDGTLCDEHNRFIGINKELAGPLVNLLESGLTVGIATGRGKSVRTALREAIPQALWNFVLVGYYNGAEIGSLSNDSCPIHTDQVCDELSLVAEALKHDVVLAKSSKITCGYWQISIEFEASARTNEVWAHVQQIVSGLRITGISVLSSSHSVDVLPPGISKQQVVRCVEQLVDRGQRENTQVLCIGDRGRFPGNDYALLKEACSLSVDEVSADAESCWNLAPLGYRGVQATLFYLDRLTLVGGKTKLRI